MKMKHNIYFAVLLLPVFFSACKKLDQEPVSTATNESVFNTKEGLDLYANSFYSILPTASDIHKSDQMSDFGARNAVPDFLREGGFSARQSSGWSWTDLRNINYFLENNKSTSIQPEIRRNYNGLARFFRAYFYFEKVKRFGDVPWINRTFKIDDQALFNGRDSRTLVIDSIIADLDYAAANITASATTNPSIINKSIALGLKSRVCLFEGTFRKYHTEYNLTTSAAGLLTQAADAAKKVIDGNGYSLNTGGGTALAYRTLFISTAPVTTEIMLAANVNPALSVFHDANWWWPSSTYGARV
ncbi:MAG: RagB/SusD family nutrient uptake outer membrane protein, partial [Mucilaginibacter polytrichastri]|nr:RagB/SusD family nutrient uptake outer membrane protein [Mucilaginibacter polytrichastri]